VVRDQLLGGLVFLLALGVTTGALAALHALVSRPAHLLEVAVLAAASVIGTVVRYVALRWWVFATRTPLGTTLPAS
jgi:putative flippase GtrA